MALCDAARATVRVVTEKDTLGNVTCIIELNDTVVRGEAQTDTLSITHFESHRAGTVSAHHARHEADAFWDTQMGEDLVTITGIISVFFMPTLIVVCYFYFRYKNRRARYRLAEQALASGQPLPADFFQQKSPTSDQRSKGVKSICMGIGLFIFLWALTDEFGLACIGLLIMFMGFGQVIAYYLTEGNRTGQNRRDEHQPGQTPEA